ncbi:MAG: fused MFS/spermidine synthase [Phycisphaerae bacterium]
MAHSLAASAQRGLDARVRSGAVGLAVLCVFCVSGAAGLIHEVAWTRLLRLVMGNDTFSITTVVCVFMGGLALGSYVGGRIVDRRNEPLKMFALLEAGVGVYCATLPWLVHAAEPVYRYLYQSTAASFYTLSLARFLFSGLLLLIPATAMGATLPVLAKFFAGLSSRVGWSVGAVYAVNTFGAVAGAGLSGFVIIPALGVTGTIFLASALNLSVAAAAYTAHRRIAGRGGAGASSAGTAVGGELTADAPPQGARTRRPASDPMLARGSYGPWALRILLAGYGLSGFAALAFEIAWTRALAMMLGSSVYAFSMILAAFIFGLAAGGAVAARFADRIREPMRALGIIEVAIGLSALLVVPFMGELPMVVFRMVARSGHSFWQLQMLELGLVVLVTVVPTSLMGAALPLASRIYVQSRRGVGRSVGAVYASNTLGSILGSFGCGFVLIPILGIERSMFAAASCNVLVGCAFLALSKGMAASRQALAVGAALTASVLAMLAIPRWDQAMMTSGPYLKARRLLAADVERATAKTLTGDARLLFYKEGLGTTVAVTESGVNRVLMVNGKPDASTGQDAQTQFMLAHVPMLLHPDPRQVLVIGLGSGITLGAAALYPAQRLDCVEISPPVVEASHFFDDVNHRPLDDKRVHLAISDGRNHVKLTDRRYDVIISEPSNPWIAGIADLFTREFFQSCHDKLTERGVACIWVCTYDMKPEAFRSIVKAFGTVFKSMSIWQSQPGDRLLVGCKSDLAVDEAALEERMAWPAIAPDLKSAGIAGPADFLGRLLMGTAGAAGLARGATMNTDDNAFLEFSSPALSQRENQEEAMQLNRMIEDHCQADFSFITSRPEQAARRDALLADAADFFRARRHLMQAEILAGTGRLDDAIDHLRAAAAKCSGDAAFERIVQSYLRYVSLLSRDGRNQEAAALCRRLVDAVPSNAEARYQLGLLLAGQGRNDEAAVHYRRAIELRPDWPMPMNNLAVILASARQPTQADLDEAVRLAERVCGLTGRTDAAALGTLGKAYAAAGRHTEAVSVLEQAVALANKSDKVALVAYLQALLAESRNRAKAPARPTAMGSSPTAPARQ